MTEEVTETLFFFTCPTEISIVLSVMNTNMGRKVTIVTKEGKKIRRSHKAIRHVGQCTESVDDKGDIVNRDWKFTDEIIYRRERCVIEKVDGRSSVWKIVD